MTGKHSARMSPLAAPTCEACEKACEGRAAESEKDLDSKKMQFCVEE